MPSPRWFPLLFIALVLAGCGGSNSYWGPTQPAAQAQGASQQLSLAVGRDGSYPGADGHGDYTVSPAPAQPPDNPATGVYIYHYAKGTRVTVTAQPASGTRLRWNGGQPTDQTTMQATLDEDVSIGLLFVLASASG
jgi:hypothetical protein